MAVQRAFDITLAEGKTKLLEVTRVGTQDHDGTRVQVGAEYQPVQVVALHLAAPDLCKQRFEAFADARKLGTRCKLQTKVVDPQARLADAVRVFIQHTRSHVFEHRQRVRQGDLGYAVDLEAQQSRRCIQRAIQLHRQRVLWLQLVEQLGVLCRNRRAEVLAVGDRKHVGKPAGQGQARAFTMASQHFGGAIVFPALGHAGDALLQRRHVHPAHRVALGPHHIVDACQRAVGEHGGELQRLPVQRRHQRRADLDPQLGVVAVTLYEDLRRGEAPERIMAQEHPGALAFLQPQYADGVFAQGRDIDLEQLVARITVQDRLQGFGGMAVGYHTSASDHLGGTAAHPGYVTDRRRIGSRGVEAQETVFTDQLARDVESLHGNIVQPGRAMYGRACHGLGHQQQVVAAQQGHCLCRQAGLGSLRRAPQYAQASAGAGHQGHVVALAAQVVVTCAEEGEVAVLQPLQECHSLVPGRFGQRRGGALRPHLGQALQHGLPVVDGGAHVAQHPGQVSRQVFPVDQGDQAVTFDGDQGRCGAGSCRLVPGTHPSCLQYRVVCVTRHQQQRVDDPVCRAAIAVYRHGHRIDQKRHVVVHDLDHRMFADETVLCQARVEHAHPGTMGFGAATHQSPVRIGQSK